jgi:hypothetical protein
MLKRKMIPAVAAACLLFACTPQKKMQGGGDDKKEVLAKMRLANQYFMNEWPDPGKETNTDKVRPSNIWTRAVYYEGLMALYSIDHKKEYYDYAIDWGKKHNWSLWGGIETGSADNQACGQTYLDLYVLDGKKNPERIEQIKQSIDKMVKSDKKDDWWWIDALQMGMPVFVRLGVIFNDTGYFRKMYDLYAYTKYKHGDCIIRPIIYGGAIKILIRLTKNPTEKIATGVVVMAGCLQPWREHSRCYQKQIHIIMSTCRISKTWPGLL